jgi:hypothetical protein
MKAYALKLKRLDNGEIYYLANEGNIWVLAKDKENSDILKILFVGSEGKEYLLKQAKDPGVNEKFIIEHYDIVKKR